MISIFFGQIGEKEKWYPKNWLDWHVNINKIQSNDWVSIADTDWTFKSSNTLYEESYLNDEIESRMRQRVRK